MKALFITAILIATLGSFSHATDSHKHQGAPVINKSVVPEMIMPLWNPANWVCGDVYLTATLPPGTTFTWLGSGNSCTQNVSAEVIGSTVSLVGTGPANSLCKYRYALSNASGTATFTVGIRVLPQPCQ